jgi:serine/threonine protein kinase
MGEVYRARDAKLKRDVAIKILPEEFSRDSDRVTRFQREAEALAALNHQNIAGIYDLQQSEKTRFLVLELVEGETLADIIHKRGALPLDEVLSIAKQICEALEAAHEKGIVHRDLKPANVKILPDGKVKVLDFGLAKALDITPADPALSNSPTLSMAATNAGIILGTAAYMSPEQAKGRSVDRRTDIFAFGCVLFEIVTGQPAFDGEDVTDILSRILQRDPDWTRLPGNVPPPIQTLLRICLEKDVKKRRQTAADVRIDLDQTTASPAKDRPLVAAHSTPWAWIASFTIAVALIWALMIPAVHHLQETAPPELRLEINTPSTASPLEFALSPDGRFIVVVASGDGPQRLWLRALDKTGAQPIVGTEGANYPFWSPDSRSIGFFASNKLYRIDVTGGPPQVITNASIARGGAWNSAGTILFCESVSSPMFRVPASGGEPVVAIPLDTSRYIGYRYPQFLPDGQHFLFYAQGAADVGGIFLGSLSGEEPKRLTAADTAGAYVKPDWVVFVRQGTLVARHLDLAHRTLTGDPIVVADPIAYDGSTFLGAFSISTDGRIAYRSGGAELRQLQWFDRAGKALGPAGEPDPNGLLAPELSPDERRVAMDRTIQTNRDIWLMDLMRGGLTRLTFDPAIDGFPVWSPDGTKIVFESSRKGSYDMWLMLANKTGSEELLFGTPMNEWPVHWSKDGRFLLYYQSGSTTGSDLWALPMSGGETQGHQATAVNNEQGRKPIVVANTKFEERQGQFSPDGRWVAYETNESGRFEIVVQPFPDPSSKVQVSTNGGTQPRWRADGKELYFIAPDRKLMAVPVTVVGTNFEPGKPVPLFQTRIMIGPAAAFRAQYAVSHDDRFLIAQLVEESNVTPITLILNWNPDQKK